MGEQMGAVVGGYPGLSLRPSGEHDFASLGEGGTPPGHQGQARWDASHEAARLRAIIRPGLDQIVLLEGRPIGILAMTAEPHRLWLRRIHILSADQGKGVGTALINFVLTEGCRLGLPVFLRVHRDNRAQLLYARLGFRITGEASGDRLEMTKGTLPPVI
jgi:GNAT superfamily N-acetyltransferase